MNSKNLSRQHDHNKFSLSAAAVLNLLCFLVLINIVIYLPVLNADFLWYDDDVMVFNNPLITSLDFPSIINFFSFENIVHYHPLVYLTYAVEHSLFGLDPFYYHLDNVLLHSINVILVFYLVYELSRNKNAAFIAALLFTVHPLHVESIAWVTERKDLLYSMFYLSSLILYVKYSKKGSTRLYIHSLHLFVLSCLSKAMAVTLPLVIVLIELTLLNKSISSIRKKIFYFLPYFAVTVFTSLINLKVAYYETGIEIYSLYERIALVCYAILFYPFKMFYPFGLSAIYGFPEQPGAFILASPPILFTLVLLIFVFRQKISIEIKFGLLFYCITLIPVLPILPFGISATADRFGYIPLAGLFYIAAVFIVRAYSNYKNIGNRKYIAAGFVLVILLFSFLTYSRAQLWVNSEVLMNDVIEKDPGNCHAYYILGNYYSAAGSIEKAKIYYMKCIALKGTYSEAHYNLGNVYFRAGSLKDAANCFLKAVELNPMDRLAHNNLGVTYENLGEYDKAFKHYRLSADMGYEPAAKVLKYYGVLK